MVIWPHVAWRLLFCVCCGCIHLTLTSTFSCSSSRSVYIANRAGNEWLHFFSPASPASTRARTLNLPELYETRYKQWVTAACIRNTTFSHRPSRSYHSPESARTSKSSSSEKKKCVEELNIEPGEMDHILIVFTITKTRYASVNSDYASVLDVWMMHNIHSGNKLLSGG